MTLADLVAEQHDLLLERFAAVAAADARSAGLARVELIDSMSFFLDDLVETLATGRPLSAMDSAAASHGVERLGIGFRIDRVVLEYGILGQLVVALAAEHDFEPSFEELSVLFDAVGNGAAIAAGEYVRRREADLLQRESEHAAFLAHEVRNSLASARFAFGLLRGRRELTPEEQPLADIVDGGLRQASRRIDDALTGARMRGGIISPVRIFPALILEEIAAELRPQAEARHIAVAVVAPADLTTHADARLVRSAIENLVNNAIKFSRDGGHVTLAAAPHGDQLVIEVGDSCGGLDEGKFERLFKPFVQESDERSGFGLGLAIARECAEAQGGALGVRNVPGEGCVFTLTIPLRP